MFVEYNRLDRQTDRQTDGRNCAVIRSFFARNFISNDKPFCIRRITPVY